MAVATLERCRDELRELAVGSFRVFSADETAQISIRLIEEARRGDQFRATSYVDSLSFWNRPGGQRYLKANIEAVQRDVEITRVFIGTREEISALAGQIRQQTEGGIHTLVAYVDEIDPQLQRDLLIRNNDFLMITEPTREGRAREERITWNEAEVARALRIYNILVANSRYPAIALQASGTEDNLSHQGIENG